MKPIYPTLDALIEGLDAIEGARRMDHVTELDGGGQQLAKEMEAYRVSSSASGKGLMPLEDPADGRDDDGDVGDEPGSPIFWFADGVDEEDVLKRLAGARGEEYRRLALVRGIDAFGWYMTFHQKAYQWGVYVPVTGVAALAMAALETTPIDPLAKLHVALRFILAHERFHFAADVGLAQIERIVEKPVYLPTRDSARRDEASLLEEQIATAFALRQMRYSREPNERRAYRDMDTYVRTMPKGYRDAHAIVNSRHALEGEMLNHAQTCWEIGLGLDLRIGVELHHLYPAFRPYELVRCPTHVLLDQARYELGDLPLFLINSVPSLRESRQFEKQLDRLPESVRDKWPNACRKLRASVATPGLDFKPWPKGGQGCFSVRITRGVRAHLRFRAEDQSWIAEAIGSHTEMGHG